jgi:hypothetical protein
MDRRQRDVTSGMFRFGSRRRWAEHQVTTEFCGVGATADGVLGAYDLAKKPNDEALASDRLCIW